MRKRASFVMAQTNPNCVESLHIYVFTKRIAVVYSFPTPPSSL